jgi:polyphenol oxidase
MLIHPEWAAPASVGALMSTRQGGVSAAPWHSLNIGLSVGDDPVHVATNRERVFAGTGASPRWLHLVHGTAVQRWLPGEKPQPLPKGDAAWTDVPGLACVVTAADCLPVLFSTRDGRAVAAAHAGWRGLAAGVIEATVQALCDGTGCVGSDIVAWLGPCIGPSAFEVGDDVLQAFSTSADAAGSTSHFTPHQRADGSACWLADLPALARQRLQRVGVTDVTGGHWCTVSDSSRFFSFRRERTTGRMLAAVWRRR